LTRSGEDAVVSLERRGEGIGAAVRVARLPLAQVPATLAVLAPWATDAGVTSRPHRSLTRAQAGIVPSARAACDGPPRALRAPGAAPVGRELAAAFDEGVDLGLEIASARRAAPHPAAARRTGTMPAGRRARRCRQFLTHGIEHRERRIPALVGFDVELPRPTRRAVGLLERTGRSGPDLRASRKPASTSLRTW
jgi:hypothetical protein